jgi:hypothetical protein
MEVSRERKARSVRLALGIAIVALSTLGCRVMHSIKREFTSNYSFGYSRDGKGNFDVDKLIHDHKPGGLRENVVIPLVYANQTTFDNEHVHFTQEVIAPVRESSLTIFDPEYPQGWRLQQLVQLGPFGIFWLDMDESHFDGSGCYERRERLFVLWRLYAEQRTSLMTTYGPREEARYSLLFGLLPFYQSVVYPEPSPEEKQIAPEHQDGLKGSPAGSSVPEAPLPRVSRGT